MKRKLKTLLALALCLLLVGSFLVYGGNRYLPERTEYGALWNQYLEEPENSVDLLVLGSSHAYCSVVPATVYRDAGVTAYVLAAPSATTSVIYYYLKEALRTQHPQTVMVEATSFFFHRYEDFTKADVGYMPWGRNRLEATFRAAEPAERLGLLFPLYNYHTRWQDISVKEFFSPRGDRVTDPLAGYTFLDKAEPQAGLNLREVTVPEEELAENLEYLEKILSLCQGEGIRVTLFLAPTCLPLPEDRLQDLAQAAGDVPVVDFTEGMETMGLDLETDFYDHSHLNCLGAEKFSRYLAGWLREELALGTTQGEDKTLWQDRVVYWEELLGNGKLKMEN